MSNISRKEFEDRLRSIEYNLRGIYTRLSMPDTVRTEQLVDGSVTADKIASGAVEGAVQTTSALGQYLTNSARATAGGLTSIWLIGDSNGAGSNGVTTGFVGGWRHGLEAALLQLRMDIDFVGSTATIRELSDSGLCWHDCHAGEKIEDATTNLSARLAKCHAVPDLVFHSLGTNNIVAGDSAATMLTKFQAWATALFAALPNVHVFVVPPVPLVDGTTTHANLSAWQAVRASYITLLTAYVATESRMTLVLPPELVGGDIMVDGIHLTRSGQVALGKTGANAIDLHLGPAFRQGPRVPRTFKQYKPKNSVLCATETTDGLSSASPNGYAAGANSFVFAIDIYPTAVATTIRTIATFGTYGAPGTGFWMLTQTNGAVAWYWDNPSVPVGSGDMALIHSLVPYKWHRIVCIAYLNGSSSSAGVYVNGRLAGILTDLPAWDMSSGIFTLGKEGAFGQGVTGYYGRVRAYKGANVPVPGSMAALQAVLSDYYEDGALVAGECCAYHDMDGNLNDAVYGGRGLSLVGSAVNAAPYPNGTPIRPWEFTADYPGDFAVLVDGGLTEPKYGTGSVSSRALAASSVTDAAVASTSTLGAYLSASSRAALGTIVPIWLIGDSNGVGSNGATTGHVGGWRHALERALIRRRGDFDFVGSTVTTREVADCGLCWHDCYAGEKIEDATAALATRLAGCASTPQIVVECLGTNNLTAGDSAATILTKQIAYEAALFAALPNAHLFVVAPPPLIDGSTTHASLAALQAAQASYNSLLQAHCATDSRITYVSSSVLAKGEFQLDGVHLNRGGQQTLGEAIADPVDRYLGPAFRMGPPTPRVFKQRKAQYSLLMGTAATDGANCASGNGYAGGANSMMVALDLYPTALDAALRTIICYGNYADMGGAGAWMLSQNNGALSVYWNNPSGTLGGASYALTRGLVVNKWHRIVIAAHLNGAASSLGVYINAKLAGVIGGLAAWNYPAAALNLGKEGVTFANGQKGYYSRLRAFRGASVPRPGSKAAQIAVESDYYDDGALVPGAGIAWHDLDGALTDMVYGGTSFTAVGSTAFAGPYPAGTPIRPWEFAADYV